MSRLCKIDIKCERNNMKRYKEKMIWYLYFYDIIGLKYN